VTAFGPLSVESIGVAVFALSGALVAARKGMDPFGFALLATVTGVGGGTLRDLLIGADPVFWVGDPTDVLVCLVVAAATFCLGPRRIGVFDGGLRGRALLWADALGLALFAVVGTGKALAAGVPALSAVALGTVTATFGGIIRDMLAGTTPLVLRQEIYVTAAALGAAVMVGLIGFEIDPVIGASAGFAASFILRALALLRGWSLPAFPRRD
jgi:uncharacterized membrane protein YeiH